MASVMAATATVKRKASSTEGWATARASLENMKLMPKMTEATSAASRLRIWIFSCFMGHLPCEMAIAVYDTTE